MTVTIYKRDGSSYWWIRYRDSDGNVVRKSTGTKDEQAACEIAEQLEEELAKEAASEGHESSSSGDTADHPLDQDALGHRIDRLEDLMLAIARHQAQGQEVMTKRLTDILRDLSARTQSSSPTISKDEGC